jgi:hypothetical protein
LFMYALRLNYISLNTDMIKITVWSIVLLETLIIAQLLMKLVAFYGN